MDKTEWISGEWNAICDICGFQFKASKLRENWKKQRVCEDDWEPRHPQEFVRPRHEDLKLPWQRPDDTQGHIDTTQLISAVPNILAANTNAQLYNYRTGTVGIYAVQLPSANDAAYGGVSTSITIFHYVTSPSSTDINIVLTAASGTINGSTAILPGQTARFVNYPSINTWQREI